MEPDEIKNDGFWCVIANVKKEIPYGPGGEELKSGLKNFKAGAKLHIIGSYPGVCMDIVAIGQHRKSGKYIKCVIRANSIENLRLKQVYSRTIIGMLEGLEVEGALIATSQSAAEELLKTIPRWAEEM